MCLAEDSMPLGERKAFKGKCFYLSGCIQLKPEGSVPETHKCWANTSIYFPFHCWCVATILCVLKPYNGRSIAECETTSRNVLSQMCMRFCCQSTSPGRLQRSTQAGEVLVQVQFKFVPYKSVFKTLQCCTSPNPSHRISQFQATVRYHYTEASQRHQTIMWLLCTPLLHSFVPSQPSFIAYFPLHRIVSISERPTFTFMAYCCLLGEKVYHRTVCVLYDKRNVLPEGKMLLFVSKKEEFVGPRRVCLKSMKRNIRILNRSSHWPSVLVLRHLSQLLPTTFIFSR